MIIVYDGYTSNDYTKMGLGTLQPIECVVTEEAGGSCEMELRHPLDNEGKWQWLQTGNLIKAPCPVISVGSTASGTDQTVWKTTTQATLYSRPDAPTRITYQQWVISTPYDQGSKVTYAGNNYQSTQILMDQEIHRSPDTLPSKWRRIQNYTSGSSAVATLGANVEVVMISEYNASWNRVRTNEGTEGYLQKSVSAFVRTETRQPVEQRIVKDQLFRIYKTQISTSGTEITVNAQHASYDLAGILLGPCKMAKTTPAGAVAAVQTAMLEDAQCTIATDLPDSEEAFTADYSFKNPIYALTDPKEGIAPFYGAKLIRDNWDLFVLKNDAPDRGFAIRYGVNLVGVNWKTDTQKVITRIIPIAKKADDTDLMLPEKFVDSPYISSYPTPISQSLTVDGKVGADDGEGGTWTEARLLDHMRDMANAKFDEGCDLPSEEISVDFLMLGDTAEYAQYKDLQKLYLYDTVTAYHKDIRLNRKLQVRETKWDAVSRKFIGIELASSMEYVGVSIAGFQIASNTVTGRNISRSAVGQDALADGAIIARTIGADAVTAGKIQAGSVSTDKLAAGSVTAGKIAAGAVETDKLAASAVTADQIAADAVEAHHLSADALSAIDAEIGSANIGYAQIKDALIQNLITKDAIADRYYIQKLMVQNLQVIEQTVQNLVVKASNGNYYRLDVNPANGAVTSTQVTVTAGEISAGVTTSGRSIIDTDILAADLSATNIKGANALIDRITASRLDVGELFARQAFISQLNTTDIRSNTYLQAYVGQQIDLSVGPIAIGNINWFENSDGYYEVTGPSSNTSFQFAFGDIAKHWNLFCGKQITVSFDIELENATGNGTGVFIEPQFWFSDSSYQSFQIVYTLNTTPRTLSARAAKTFTVQDKALNHVAQSGIYIYGLTGGRVKVGRPKLEIGSKATEWTLAPTELKNTSVNINRQGIYMNTGGIIDMKAGTAVNISGADGMIDIRGNGTIGATSGNFTDLMVGGKQIGVTDFLMPVPCKFTQGQSSAPAGHGFLWLNASGSSYSQASAQGAPAVGYLPQTFNISAPTNVLSSGTFDYSLTFAVTHRQASTPGSITVNVAVKITNPTTGANLTFNFGSVTLRLWQSVTRTITITGSSINLMGANAALRAECSRTAGTVLTYLDSNVNLVLTATKQNAGGAQSVTMQYVP